MVSQITPTNAIYLETTKHLSFRNESELLILQEKLDFTRIEVKAGQILVIPPNAVYTVYTLEDSLVYAGAFLGPFHLPYSVDAWRRESREKNNRIFIVDDITTLAIELASRLFTERGLMEYSEHGGTLEGIQALAVYLRNRKSLHERLEEAFKVKQFSKLCHIFRSI